MRSAWTNPKKMKKNAIQHEQLEQQTVANTMENERFELQNAATSKENGQNRKSKKNL